MASVSPQIAVSAAALTDDPRRAPQLSRRLGFGGLVFPAASSAGGVTELSAPRRRGVPQTFSAPGPPLVPLAADLGPRGFAPGADVDRVLARLDRVLEAARGLAVPLVCADLGPLPPAPQAAKPKPRVTSQMAGLILLPETGASQNADAMSQP